MHEYIMGIKSKSVDVQSVASSIISRVTAGIPEKNGLTAAEKQRLSQMIAQVVETSVKNCQPDDFPQFDFEKGFEDVLADQATFLDLNGNPHKQAAAKKEIRTQLNRWKRFVQNAPLIKLIREGVEELRNELKKK